MGVRSDPKPFWEFQAQRVWAWLGWIAHQIYLLHSRSREYALPHPVHLFWGHCNGGDALLHTLGNKQQTQANEGNPKHTARPVY